MRSVPRALVGVLVAAALVPAGLFALAGCAATPQSAPQAGSGAGSGATFSAPSPSASPGAPKSNAEKAATLGTDDNPVRVAIVGDSLTAGGGRTLPEMGLDQNTWMTYAEGNGVTWVGGWAKGGTTVQTMAANVRPVDHVDVLVLMAGTNDVRLRMPFAAARPYYDRIIDTIKPDHVIIGGIPPFDRNPKAATAYERELTSYVATKGWDFVDPWGFARHGERYAAGTTLDGIHPTTAGYRTVGHEFRDAILRVVATPVAG